MAVDTAATAPSPHPPSTEHVMVLTGPGTSPVQLARSVWESRALIGVLARKDFLVRYRRTRLGLAWAVLLPLAQAAVLAVVFTHLVGRVPGRNAGGRTATYAVFVFSGIVPWSAFSNAFSTAASSVVDGSDLARRIYFPRIVLPVVAVLASIFPLLITVVILLGMEVILGAGFGLRTLWIIPGLALGLALTTGLSLLVSVSQVYLRDLKFLVAASLTVLFYATPVIYPLSRLPHGIRTALLALPTSGPVELFRQSVGAADPHWGRYVASTAVWTLVTGLAGLALHCRRDRVMTDLL